MKNGFITGAMWTLFAPSFQKQLTVLGVSDGKAVMEKAREMIILGLCIARA